MPPVELNSDVALGVAIPSRNARGRIARLGSVVDAILGSVTYGLVIQQTGNEAQYGRKYKVSDNFQGMAVRKGDQEMLDFLNDFVTRHTADGTLDALYKKWIGVDRAKLPTTLPGVDFTGKQ